MKDKQAIIATVVLSLISALGIAWATYVPTKHTISTVSLGTAWNDVPYLISRHCSIFSEEIDGDDVILTYDCKSALYVTSNGLVLAKAMKKADGSYM